MRRPRKIPTPPPNPLIEFIEPVRAGQDHLIRVVFDGGSQRWAFYGSEPLAQEIPDNLDYRFANVAEATIGALQHLQPYWGDPSSVLVIHGGITVPHMPSNARITGSSGYRAGLDANLYYMDQAQLQAEHARTFRQSNQQARETATSYDIPLGQQVHAFRKLHQKQWPGRRNPLAPKLNDWLDQMMPKVDKRRRERHYKVFAIVSSEDWPVIVQTTEIEISGMDSILKAARAFSPARPKHKKTRTPLKQRYDALRVALLTRQFEAGRRQALGFDEEDDDDAPAGSYNDNGSE